MQEVWNTRWRAAFIAGGTFAVAILGTFAVSQSQAQTQEKFKNLKVLPQDISHDDLESTMHGFTDALGVHCSYCHVRPGGKGRGEPDWASDAKPEKQTARVMMEMMKRITGTELIKIATNHPDRVVFNCRTCHRGQTRPWQIGDVLATAYRSGGFDSLTRGYEGIRKKYYGSDTYDLGERMLPDLAETIVGPDSAAAALRFGEYNLKWYPQSGYTYLAIGRARDALGEKEQAVKDLQRAAELDPKLQEYVQRTLERMKRN